MKLLPLLFLLFTLTFQSKTSQASNIEDNIILEYLWSEVINLKAGKERPKIAIVLSGGGARGFAHIGVLRILEENKVPIDIVVGTSAGAIIGALYSAGIPLEKLESMADDIGWTKFVNLDGTSVINLLTESKLLSTEKMTHYLKKYLGNKNFYELKKKFACVATDIVTGEKIIFSEGKVADAVMASATIPGIFEPINYRHRALVDGGLIDNIPVELAKNLGADITIVSTARSDFSKNNPDNVFKILTQAIYIQGAIIENRSLQKADIVISSNVKDISAVDLSRANECISAGIKEASSKIDDVKKLIISKTFEYTPEKREIAR